MHFHRTKDKLTDKWDHSHTDVVDTDGLDEGGGGASSDKERYGQAVATVTAWVKLGQEDIMRI